MQGKNEPIIDIFFYHDKILSLSHNYKYMSGGHRHDDGHGAKKSGGSIKMDIGIGSMIAGFFGAASGAGAVEMYK
jgi:hypothetical protein